MKPDVTVVIPFLNEAENIPELHGALEAYAADAPFRLEVVFVDDGSTDGSGSAVAALCPAHYEAKLVRLSRNFGSHAAIRAGLTVATGRYTTCIGADMQEPLSMVTAMYEKMQEGYGVVCVEKARVQVGLLERTFSHLYAGLIRKYAVSGMPKNGTNALMFSEKIRSELNAHVESDSSFFLQILNMGYKTALIQAEIGVRKNGVSKWTLAKKIKLFIDSFVAFSYMPIRLISVLGILFSVIGVLLAVAIVITKLVSPGALAAGWPTLISVLLIGFGMTNASLGILAEYLWRTLGVVRQRPVFLIDTVQTLSEKQE